MMPGGRGHPTARARLNSSGDRHIMTSSARRTRPGLLLRLEEDAAAPRRCDPLPVDDHVLPHERFEDSHSPPPSSSFLLLI